MRRYSDQMPGLKARLVSSTSGGAPAPELRRCWPAALVAVAILAAAAISAGSVMQTQQYRQLLTRCQEGRGGGGGGGSIGGSSTDSSSSSSGTVAASIARALSRAARAGAAAAAGLAASGPGPAAAGGARGGAAAEAAAAAPAVAAGAAPAAAEGAAAGPPLRVSPAERAAAAAVVERLRGRNGTYAAFCLIVRGDHARIREWVAYHWAVGVERFYIYDDNSTPPLEGTLRDLIAAGVVHYRHLTQPLGKPHQVAVYRDCIDQHRAKHTWLAFLDSDEFLIIRDGSADIPTVLKRYESYGGLVVSWRWYGSSGHITPPPTVLDSFTACGPELHDHVKTLVRTDFVEGPSTNPHAFLYKPGYFAVNTAHAPMGAHAYLPPPNASDPAPAPALGAAPAPASDPAPAPASDAHPEGDVLVLNHYVVRSLEEFKFKIARGSAMQFGKTMPFFDVVEAQTTANCTYAVPLAAKARAQLRLLAAAAAPAAS